MTPDAAERAHRSLDKGLKHEKAGHSGLAIAAGLRAVTWAVLYVGEQLKRQVDFWERGG